MKEKKPLACEICRFNGSLRFIGFGVISPWIRELAGLSFKNRSRLFYCTNCKCAFFSYRYSPPRFTSFIPIIVVSSITGLEIVGKSGIR